MKNFLLSFFILVSFIGYTQSKYHVNTNTATLHWKGFKSSGSHNGTINLKDGFFTVKNNQITGGDFIIDMNSIIVLDLPSKDKSNNPLVNHLKSVNFFEVSTYPTAKFEITYTENKEDKALIKGKLTLKDKTNPVEFLATVTIDGNNLIFNSETFKIDRCKWNVKYNSKSFFKNLKDRSIDDDIEISIEIKANK